MAQVLTGITLAIWTVLLFPLDVANRNSCSPDLEASYCTFAIPSKTLWYILYIVNACLVFGLIPFAIFYYEADSEVYVPSPLFDPRICLPLHAVPTVLVTSSQHRQLQTCEAVKHVIRGLKPFRNCLACIPRNTVTQFGCSALPVSKKLTYRDFEAVSHCTGQWQSASLELWPGKQQRCSLLAASWVSAMVILAFCTACAPGSIYAKEHTASLETLHGLHLQAFLLTAANTIPCDTSSAHPSHGSHQSEGHMTVSRFSIASLLMFYAMHRTNLLHANL